jgi:hypothetical protein
MSARPLQTGLIGERVTAPVLSRHERIVLEVVCRFPDRRAIAERIPGERQMTQAEWQTARLSLIGKKLLDRAGAITHAGRQAIGEDA